MILPNENPLAIKLGWGSNSMLNFYLIKNTEQQQQLQQQLMQQQQQHQLQQQQLPQQPELASSPPNKGPTLKKMPSITKVPKLQFQHLISPPTQPPPTSTKTTKENSVS